jgi:predicted flap endonuclease-1-like 5' DNA nuclease
MRKEEPPQEAVEPETEDVVPAPPKLGDNGRDLQRLPGIGAVLAKMLKDDGIESYADLIDLGVQGLAAYKGIGEKKATMILQVAEKAL